MRSIPYASLLKGDKFSLCITLNKNTKCETHKKFNDAWAIRERDGNWISMISTESVSPFTERAGIQSV